MSDIKKQLAAWIDEDRDKGRQGAREIAGGRRRRQARHAVDMKAALLTHHCAGNRSVGDSAGPGAAYQRLFG